MGTLLLFYLFKWSKAKAFYFLNIFLLNLPESLKTMHINLVIRFKLLCQHCTQVTSDINVDQFMHLVFRFVYFRVRVTPTIVKLSEKLRLWAMTLYGHWVQTIVNLVFCAYLCPKLWFCRITILPWLNWPIPANKRNLPLIKESIIEWSYSKD